MKETKYKGYFISETGDLYSHKQSKIRKLKPEYIRSGYIRYKVSVNLFQLSMDLIKVI